MSVKLVEREAKPGICVNDMKDGQIAEVVMWNGSVVITGDIVQRWKDDLAILGEDSGESESYGSVFGRRREDLRVRLLEPGETIEIVDN
jgi:hypothetical protein